MLLLYIVVKICEKFNTHLQLSRNISELWKFIYFIQFAVIYPCSSVTWIVLAFIYMQLYVPCTTQKFLTYCKHGESNLLGYAQEE